MWPFSWWRTRGAAPDDWRAGRELELARKALRQREAELADCRLELNETNRGLIALHGELEEARQAQARLAAIVQSSDDAMVSLSPDGIVLTWNPGAERLFGHRAADIVGRDMAVLVPPGHGQESEAAITRVRTGRRAETYETKRARKDGTLVDVAVTVSAMRDAAGTLTGFAVVLRDVTQRLRVEAELAAARAQQEVLAERDRMARDLHDSVVQRLFAAGLALQSTVGRIDVPALASRVGAVIGELDASIGEIRGAIYTLRQAPRPSGSSRAQILGVVSEVAPALGFSPAVSFDGAIETVPDYVTTELLAVIREALTNIAKHAHASAAEVTVSVGAELVLRVSDNGRGLGPLTRASGLRNLRERAELLGGSFEVGGGETSGTTLVWRAPLES